MIRSKTAHEEPFIGEIQRFKKLDSSGLYVRPGATLALPSDTRLLNGVERVVAGLVIGDVAVDVQLTQAGDVQVAYPGYEAVTLASRDPHILGRRAMIGATWNLPQYVSREHVAFSVLNNGVVWVRDNNSLNGTQLYVPEGSASSTPPSPEREQGLMVEVGAAEKRVRGEDRYVCKENYGLFGVFDGVGGSLGGADAAETAAAQLSAAAQRSPHSQFTRVSPHVAEEWLIKTLDKISNNISRHSDSGYTTATVARLVESNGEQFIVWASIGDSRLYLVRSGRAIPMTSDEGVGRYLYRAMGLDEQNNRTINQSGRVQFRPSDRIVIVTDGITGDVGEQLMSAEEVARIVSSEATAQGAAQQLVHLSRKHDDGTALVVEAR